MLFHTDICYVGESLRMRLPFANLGLVPEFASSYMLQANIGAQQAAELFYTAEWINAERAVECGIAARSYGDSELLEKALEKGAEIAQWPVNALKEIKATLRLPHKAHIDAAFVAESEGMERQAGSPENIEAITAFLEKRAPKFR
jgi:enoyl-CoA hydratase/carnithine racemase